MVKHGKNMNLAASTVYWKDSTGVYQGYYNFGGSTSHNNLDEKAVVGKTDYDLFSQETADIYRQQDLSVMSNGHEMLFEENITLENGAQIVQHLYKKPQLAADGSIIGVITNVITSIDPNAPAIIENNTIRDIVRQAVGKHAPQNLTTLDYVKYLKNYYEGILRALPGHVFWQDADNVFLGCNNLHAEYAGLNSPQEIVGKTNFDLPWKEIADKVNEVNNKVMQSGEPYTIEEFAKLFDKTDIFLSQKVPLRDPYGNTIGLLGVALNITTKKREEEERLNVMLQASHMGTWRWNFEDDTFIYDHMNHNEPYRLASTVKEIITRTHPADQAYVRQALQKAREEKTNLDVEYRLKWIDGTQRYFAMRGKIVEDKKYQAYCMVGICWDITERKQQEEFRQIQQATMAQISRQNAMGELASILAHELNQPLAAISNYIDGCIIRLQKNQIQPQELLKAMELASIQSARAGEIIHRIKNFMRRGELIFSEVNVNEIINDVITTLQFELGTKQIVLQRELSDTMPILRLDEIQIGQVIMNLLRNAMEALQDANVEAPEIIIRTQKQDNHIYIDVIDNGPGCPQEIANQLFNIYFTTKKNGMGIGLAICRSIVEAHNGQLEIMPKQNGAWFRFTLPIANQLFKDIEQVRLAYQ